MTCYMMTKIIALRLITFMLKQVENLTTIDDGDEESENMDELFVACIVFFPIVTHGYIH